MFGKPLTIDQYVRDIHLNCSTLSKFYSTPQSQC